MWDKGKVPVTFKNKSRATSPLTGSDDLTLLKTISSDDLISHWKRYFEIDITEELHGYKEICLYQCNETKLKFFVPYDIVGSDWLYEQLQKFDWFYMDEKWEFDAALRDLRGCKNILEIGSGVGSFIEKGLNADLNVRGIERNATAAKEAQKRGLPVERTDLKAVSLAYLGHFDAVCCFQVLEHVSCPKDFLKWAIAALRPGGKLILCVPNSESFLKYQYNLLDMPPHHMLQWSNSSLSSLEKLFSLVVERIAYEPLAPYHVRAYLEAYVSHFVSVSILAKVIFNGYTMPLFERMLMSGFRRCLRGQSIYVCLRKQ